MYGGFLKKYRGEIYYPYEFVKISSLYKVYAEKNSGVQRKCKEIPGCQRIDFIKIK